VCPPLDTATTTISTGSVDDVTFVLGPTAPAEFYVKSDTGKMSGRVQDEGNIEFELFAVDAGGKKQVYGTFAYTATAPPEFKPVPIAVWTAPSGCDTPANDELVVNQSYTMCVPPLNTTATTVSTGSVEDVTFVLGDTAPEGFFVKSDTGKIFGRVQDEGNIEFELFAVDAGGKKQVYATYTFIAFDPPGFDLKVDSTSRTNTDPSLFTDPDTHSGPYFVGTSYRISPYTLRSDTVVSTGTLQDIRYTMEGEPDGWFVGAKNGEISGTFSGPGRYSMSLHALDAAKQ